MASTRRMRGTSARSPGSSRFPIAWRIRRACSPTRSSTPWGAPHRRVGKRSASVRSIAVTRYVTPLREGGSLPAIVEADDNGLYVLKFRGAGQGARALVAELIAGGLARAAGAPPPRGGVPPPGPGLARPGPP